MPDLSALWREDAEFHEVVETYQYLIDTGQAWLLEGHVGRTANNLIQSGYCRLGERAHSDYWGNRVPACTEIEPGQPGSATFVEATGALLDSDTEDNHE